ncbi:hypothetical protein [Streptomyces sp. MBT49]|uniref:hypothetical protein n=1 Tax=Streptomyces sp. MBT49 TaxID=1488380 RepID=UPI0027DBBA47|nr:hypothetical protein [Streptomyces sp. MBT49]
MIIAPSALNATSEAVAQLLGPTWNSLPDNSKKKVPLHGGALLTDTSSGTLTAIGIRPIFNGTVIALHLSCTGAALNTTTGQWTTGFYTWNTATPLPTGDSDPAEHIATVIRERLLPAVIRKPRHVGDQPWNDDDAMQAEVITPPPPPKPRRTRAKKTTAKKTSATT